MLSIVGKGYNRNCQGATRREFLQIGALGVGGLSLPGLMAARSNAAQGSSFVKDKAVVLLFLQGGPTQIETFDPKMTAPSEYHAMFGEVKTKLPGVTFGSHLPQLASLADKLAIVRSFQHGVGSHKTASDLVAAGGNPTKATMGTIYSRVAGGSNSSTGIPNNVVITPPAVGDLYNGLGGPVDRVTNIGSLPAAYKAFDPSSGGNLINNMKLQLAGDRLDDRKALLTQLDAIKRNVDAAGTLNGADRFQQQAFDVIVGGVSDAFDLSKEDARLVERYDTSMFEIPAWLMKKKANVPGQSPIALGKQMLMARRLVEAGCGFITVTSAGWDMHGNAFGVDDGMPLLGPSVDKAVSAFIEDLEARGLTDKVLLVVTGEFGRTPRINKKGGRDHWGNLCTLAFAGGGLPMGQVVGASDRTAGRPISEPVTVQNLLGTIMHTVFDIGQLRLEPRIPNEIARTLTSNQPIPQLIA
ncbi:MAG: DUF1501 domain-containing protein [Planctomycetes bacterium]|nr:DUF1501 domain-containing protein [Planctomycetota bacterium]